MILGTWTIRAVHDHRGFKSQLPFALHAQSRACFDVPDPCQDWLIVDEVAVASKNVSRLPQVSFS